MAVFNNVIPGYELTVVTCRSCGREAELIGIGNELVGCHDRMRCIRCGHRGAHLLRVWHVGERPLSKFETKKKTAEPIGPGGHSAQQ